ncbi:hypothetical protein Agub_g7935, partial [Astrephomene gubernaculifera]
GGRERWQGALRHTWRAAPYIWKLRLDMQALSLTLALLAPTGRGGGGGPGGPLVAPAAAATGAAAPLPPPSSCCPGRLLALPPRTYLSAATLVVLPATIIDHWLLQLRIGERGTGAGGREVRGEEGAAVGVGGGEV